MRTISVNETSKLIKQTLRAAFPHTKFSVRLEKYSGGCSIDAHWTDGPTERQVKPILDRFDGQGFDGMTDCSFYCGERTYKGEAVDFHSGYVRGSRRQSPELMRKVAARVARECGVQEPPVNDNGYIEGDYNQRVPFQWWDHWLHSEGKEYLTMADIEAPGYLLAHDAHEGEYLTRLIDKIACAVSFEQAQPVELPEYINIKEEAHTGRASFEKPMLMFEGHDKLDAELTAIADFEGAPKC